MDLIYADVINNTIVDRGIITNYNLDLSFGEDENDFVLRCPDNVTRLSENMVIYVEGTEFGGIVDSIEIDTSTRMITYSGRTWHGILESKKLYPFKGADHMILNGEANQVLKIILERLSLIPSSSNEMYVQPEGSFLTVSEEDSGIYISNYFVSSVSGNYASGYTFIRDMLYSVNAKPLIINGVLQAVQYSNYALSNAWLYDSQQFTAKKNYNSVNHVHCMGQGELADRYVIDLYLSKDGGILPYGHDELIDDSDYYTDLNALSESTDSEEVEDYNMIVANMITGVNEMCEIYDYPSAQTIYNYVLQTEEPSDWSEEDSDGEIGFAKYYVKVTDRTDENDSEYELITKPDMDVRYELLKSQPTDWATNYTAYYINTTTGFENVTTGQYSLLTSKPSNWETSYDNYFYKDGNYYYTVPTEITYPYLTSQPSAWSTQYMLYYYADGTGVDGVYPEQTYEAVDYPGNSIWNSNYSDYYYYSYVDLAYVQFQTRTYSTYEKVTTLPLYWDKRYTLYYVLYNNEFMEIMTYVQQYNTYLKNNMVSVMFPKILWDTLNGSIYEKVSHSTAPPYIQSLYGQLYKKSIMQKVAPAWAANTYCYKKEGAPTFVANTYYGYSDIPTWVRNTYYKGIDYQPVPPWQSNTYYTQVEDHYKTLVEGALNKLSEWQSKSELSIDIAEGGTEYDINDTVAASDEITGLGATARVTQKILKIERGIPSIEYKVGNV